MQSHHQKLVPLTVVAVAAVLFGVVLAGGLGLTPGVDAQRSPEASAPAAAPVPMLAPDFAALADRVVPAVVSVYGKNIVDPQQPRGGRQMPRDPFHFFFDGPSAPDEPMVRRSSGSGFFISPEGELITNNHVVEEADELEIELVSGRKYDVEVVGRDPATDLALLQVKNPDQRFEFIALGESEKLRVGEWVMAVGNPLQMDHSVTVGVVSAMGRTLGLSDTSFENYIQTDAAINQGNSGGPLVNLRGEVVGINTAINMRGQNLGFAVPVRAARSVLPQLRESGRVVRGYLGVSIRNIDYKTQQAFGLDSMDGALVDDVLEGYPAAEAGLEHGDIVVAIDGETVRDTRDLIDRVSAMPPDTRVELTVLRDGRRVQLPVVLGERDADDEQPGGVTSPERGDTAERLGLSVSELTQRTREFYRVPEGVEGVVVTRIDPSSPAADEGLTRGDVILELNGSPVSSVDEVLELIEAMNEGAYVRMYVYRPQADRSFFAIVKLR